jgi:hypothetical protein
LYPSPDVRTIKSEDVRSRACSTLEKEEKYTLSFGQKTERKGANKDRKVTLKVKMVKLLKLF